MVTVTDSAKQELKAMLSASSQGEEVGLRLVASPAGEFGLRVDEAREDDQVVEHGGAKVLLVGGEISDALEGVTIDCQETDDGRRLVMSKA